MGRLDGVVLLRPKADTRVSPVAQVKVTLPLPAATLYEWEWFSDHFGMPLVETVCAAMDEFIGVTTRMEPIPA